MSAVLEPRKPRVARSTTPRAPMPAPPVRQYSFTDWQVNNPTAPPPGDRMDAEYDRGNQSISDTITWASVSLNTDGSLRDAIVGENNLVSGLFDDVAQGVIDQVQPLVDEASSYADAASSSAATAQTSATAADTSNTAAQGAASTAASAAQNAQQQALMAGASAAKAQTAATSTANDAANTANDLAEAELYAVLTQAWAEHMPDTIPPNILAIMGITGDHWSSRWWANKAASAFGQLASLYLGAWPAPPNSTSTGEPIPLGAIYYNTVSGMPFVWNGSEWVPFYSPAKSYLLTLLYRATAGQTVFPLTTLDLASTNYELNALDPEPLEVYVNGARLPQDDPNPGSGDWTLDAATSTITFLAPLLDQSMVQIDVMSPVSALAPARVQTQSLLNFDIDPATGNPGQIDGVKTTFPICLQDTTPVMVGAAQELFVSLDGVVQQPGTDFSVNDTNITFAEPPTVGARAWGSWFGPGVTPDGPGTGYLPLMGGTMTGPLTLAAPPPTLALHAAPKNYVDGKVANYLPLTGDSQVNGMITTNPGPSPAGTWSGYQIGLNMRGDSATFGSALIFGGNATYDYAIALLRFQETLYVSKMPELTDSSGTVGETDLFWINENTAGFAVPVGMTDVSMTGVLTIKTLQTDGQNNIDIHSPDRSDGGQTGEAYFWSGTVIAGSDANSGWAGIGTGNTNGAGDSGSTEMWTGPTSGPANSGGIFLYTGYASAGSSGPVNIGTGGAAGAGNKVGDIVLQVGNSNDAIAAPGNILMVGLPTADPAQVNAVWMDPDDGFALKVSRG